MSEERLKRIEILLETCAKVAVANQTEVKEVRQQINQLARESANSQQQINQLARESVNNQQQINQLTIQIASLSEMFIESVGIMRNMQSEIKGLQTENKRILDHLFGENQNN